MKKFLLTLSLVAAFAAPAMAAGPKNFSKGKQVTCEGVIKRDPDNSTWLDSTRMCFQRFWQDLERVLKACPEGSRCEVTAIILEDKRRYGFGRVLAARRIDQDVATRKFDPFLNWTDMDNSYQGSGWINRNYISGCHEVDGEGDSKETECATSRTVEVRDNVHGRIIAGLSKGMNVIVGEGHGEWVQIYTVCAESIVPGYVDDWNRTDTYLFSCPKKPQ
jgi:hypothetical protein